MAKMIEWFFLEYIGFDSILWVCLMLATIGYAYIFQDRSDAGKKEKHGTVHETSDNGGKNEKT